MLRIGLLGLGHWGPNLLRILMADPRVEVLAVCDPKRERLEEASLVHRTQTIDQYIDSSELIERTDIDAVIIATPASMHFELVKKCIDSGKHVFCEKPLAFNRANILECGELAIKRDLKLMVGYTFLFHPAIWRLKEILDSGALGDIFYLTARRTHNGFVRADVDVMWDLACHDLAVMNYLLDSTPKFVSATGSKPLRSKNLDVAFLAVQYASEVVAQISVSWVDAAKVRQLEVIGSKARIVFDDLSTLEPLRLYDKAAQGREESSVEFGEFRYLTRDGDILSPKVEMTEPLKNEIDAFIRLVTTNCPNLSTAKFAANISATLDAATRSIGKAGARGRVE